MQNQNTTYLTLTFQRQGQWDVNPDTHVPSVSK